MSPSETDVVGELLRAGDVGDFPRVFELLSEDACIRTASGRIYIGHAGIANWIRDISSVVSERWFEPAETKALGDGFVIVTGTENRQPVHGSLEAIPGVWLYHVRRGRVTASLFFRTEREAVRSISGPRRNELPADVIERAISAFNRGAYGEMITYLDEDVRVAHWADREVHEGIGAVTLMATNDREQSGGLAIAVDHIEELEHGFCTVEGKILDREGESILQSPVIWLARVVNSLITEMIIYDDLDEARIAAALRTTESADK